MHFQVLPRHAHTPSNLDRPFVGLLRSVPWDDEGYQALFHLSISLEDGTVRPIGLTKVLQIGNRRPTLPAEFPQLDEQYCSLGQSYEFYEALQGAMDRNIAQTLTALRDVTVAQDREDLIENDEVRRVLFRFSSAHYAYAKQVGQSMQDVSFRLSCQVQGFAARHEVSFGFSRERMLGRIVVLVGENGVGKTQFLNGLIYPVLGIVDPNKNKIDNVPPVSRLILLSYSAFDHFHIPRLLHKDSVIPYVYCGLRRYSDPMRGKESVDMDDALRVLESAYEDLIRRELEEEWKACICEFGLRPPQHGFRNWVDERSAGQKYLCFVLTMLFAHLTPGALVLLDEPEMHTHPKMLASLMRQLSELLEKFDAFAIVATHSPIVLQEVPARQVRVFRLGGEPDELFPLISTYPRECFAESLDEIIKSGFGIEISDTNYMRRLSDLLRSYGSKAVEAEFDRSGLSTQLAIEWAKGRRRDDA